MSSATGKRHDIPYGTDSKSKQFSLNIEALRTPQGIANWWVKYPERYHPSGKALNNVWEIAIPTQGSWGNGDMEHFCPLPEELARRAILLSTDRGGVVCDPFAGTGTTALVAEELGRKWMALDINPKYREMFYRRMAARRPLGEETQANSNGSMANVNLRLRQLKYGLLVYKRAAPSLRLTADHVPLVLVLGGRTLRSPSPNWITGCTIQVVLADEYYQRKRDELLGEINRICKEPPLSKFQVDATVQVTTRRLAMRGLAAAGKRKLCLYKNGAFWKYAEEVSVPDLASVSTQAKLPALISDIKVSEQPAY